MIASDKGAFDSDSGDDSSDSPPPHRSTSCGGVSTIVCLVKDALSFWPDQQLGLRDDR